MANRENLRDLIWKNLNLTKETLEPVTGFGFKVKKTLFKTCRFIRGLFSECWHSESFFFSFSQRYLPYTKIGQANCYDYDDIKRILERNKQCDVVSLITQVQNRRTKNNKKRPLHFQRYGI